MNGNSATAQALRDRLRHAGIVTSAVAGGAATGDIWEEVTLPLAVVQFAPEYQRNLRQDKVRRMLARFDPKECDPPSINWREDGSFYCFDGQHRIRVILEKFGPDAQWPVRLFYGLSSEQEAALFINSQVERTAISPLERWRAGVYAGVEPYARLQREVEASGWQVASKDQNKTTDRESAWTDGIQAVGALLEIDRMYRTGHLGHMLVLLREALGTEFTPSSSLMRGLAQFLVWYEDEYDLKVLLRQMRKAGISGLRHEADTRRLLDRVTGYEAYGMALVCIYNAGRKSEHRLDEWKTVLRTRKGGGVLKPDSRLGLKE